MQGVSINPAESIFAPWWDPTLCELEMWSIRAGAGSGGKAAKSWDSVAAEWTGSGTEGFVLEFSRDCALDCAQFDALIVSVALPPKAQVRLRADTDAGVREFVSPVSDAPDKEYAMPLQGARVIRRVALSLIDTQSRTTAAKIYWMGCVNTPMLHQLELARNGRDPAWPQHLKPATFVPSFVPSGTLLMTAEELDAQRVRLAALERAGKGGALRKKAEALRAATPEAWGSDFVNFWGDRRYCRQRDFGKELLTNSPGLHAAWLGLLLKDAELLRMGARHALSIAMCGEWDDGFICRFPGSGWEHRCFVQSLCTYEVALIFNLAGELFTGAGRDFLMRSIGERGLGAISYNEWRYEYIHHCNQTAWFSPGRMAGYGALLPFWPRVRPYMELAWTDMVESLNNTVLPDGGYPEGPGYFTCVMSDGGRSAYLYSRIRGCSMASVLPECVRRSADFGEVFESTVPELDLIPMCDAWPRVNEPYAAFGAAILPESRWVAIRNKDLARRNGEPDTLFGWILADRIPDTAPAPRAFLQLPDMGVCASYRELDGLPVKILLPGNRANAGHTHEDKGSFVLEFAGDAFAMDPGTCDYSSPFSREYQMAQRHSMLLPLAGERRPAPQSPLPVDVKAVATGDATRFHAEMDCSPGWGEWYARWHRIWDSPTPGELTVTDNYVLKSGSGAVFYWQSPLPCAREGNTIVITGRKAAVRIDIPDGCTATLEELPVWKPEVVHAGSGWGGFPQTQWRIGFMRQGREGTISVRARLIPAERT